MRRVLVAAFAAWTTFASPAAADDPKTCFNNKSSADAGITACSRLISARRYKGSDLANTYGWRGNFLLKKSELDRAIADFGEAIRHNPKNAHAYNSRGLAFHLKGDFDQAIDSFDRAIKLDPKQPAPFSNRGNSWRDKGQYDRALADHDQAIRLGPKNGGLYNNRASAWREKGDLDRAIADYDRAIALEPRLSLAFSGRGLAWRAKGDLDRAIADYNQAIKLSPNNTSAFANRGIVHEGKGDYDRARADFRAAIAVEPERLASQSATGERLDITGHRFREIARARLALLSEVGKVPAAPQTPAVRTAPGVAGAPAAASVGRRIALVVGNGGYAGANALPNPPNDARIIARELRGMGFEVSEGIDLDRGAMQRLVGDFLRGAATARVALLYYAGHGMQVDGKNYLLPVNVELDSAANPAGEMIDVDTILAGLDDQVRTNIVILDACRDNPLAQKTAQAGTRSVLVRSGLAAPSGLGAGATVGAGTLIAFATAPGQVALDGDGANSPFSAALARHISTPGLEVQQMLTRVRAEVVATTRSKQVPWSNSSLLGDVYLVGTR